MSEPDEESPPEVYRMVVVHHSGVKLSKIIPLHAELIATLTQNLMLTGVFREVRFEPIPGADAGPLFPPESWNRIEPLPVDDELPPLDRPKIP